jgi:hypothetical protein
MKRRQSTVKTRDYYRSSKMSVIPLKLTLKVRLLSRVRRRCDPVLRTV